ncbi:MAG: ribonuclease III [Clostridia bacterium]|nr:ribonuclease III [Clostridia bacterium]
MTDTEKKIGYEFSNKNLLKTALTHSSYANEHRTKNNERLEFLGDSVLSIIVSDYIFKKMESVDEGDLSKFRATLVCESSLAEISKQIQLNELIYLGKGEDKTGGRRRPSIISDAFEALLGAIYLDGGLETARAWLLSLMSDRIEKTLAGKLYSDYKTSLQEIVQKDGKSSVTYKTISETGREHDKRFVVQVLINGEPKCKASGHSKKEAEQSAARQTIETYYHEKI